MAIKFATAEFGIPKKQEGEPVKFPIPDILPPWNPSSPRILPEEHRAQCFGQIFPMMARFNQTANTWEAVANLPVSQATSSISLRGKNFIACDDGIYHSKDGETQGKKISSVALVITKIERRWSGKKIKEVFHVKVSCYDKQGTSTKTSELLPPTLR